MDEKKLRDLIVRSDRWKQQAMQGQRANITVGEAKLVREALEWAITQSEVLQKVFEEKVSLQDELEQLKVEASQAQQSTAELVASEPEAYAVKNTPVGLKIERKPRSKA